MFKCIGSRADILNCHRKRTRVGLIMLTLPLIHYMSLSHRASQHILECIYGMRWLSLHLGDSCYDMLQYLLCKWSVFAPSNLIYKLYYYWSADQYSKKNKQITPNYLCCFRLISPFRGGLGLAVLICIGVRLLYSQQPKWTILMRKLCFKPYQTALVWKCS